MGQSLSGRPIRHQFPIDPQGQSFGVSAAPGTQPGRLSQIQKPKNHSAVPTTSFRLLEQENRHILEGLIRIAINPQSHLELTQQVLDKKMTHAAIEVITNLSEEFIEAIFEENSAQDD